MCGLGGLLRYQGWGGEPGEGAGMVLVINNEFSINLISYQVFANFTYQAALILNKKLQKVRPIH